MKKWIVTGCFILAAASAFAQLPVPLKIGNTNLITETDIEVWNTLPAVASGAAAVSGAVDDISAAMIVNTNASVVNSNISAGIQAQANTNANDISALQAPTNGWNAEISFAFVLACA
jgi:hypothetical protein